MFIELIALAGKQQKALWFYFSLMAIRGAITVIPLIILYQIIQDIVAHVLTLESILIATIELVLIYLIINIMDHLLYIRTMTLGHTIASNIRAEIEEKLNRLPLYYSTQTAIGTQTMILGNYPSKLETGVYIINLIVQYAVAAVAIVLYFAILDWRLALAALVNLPLIFLAYYRLKVVMERIHQEKEIAHRKFGSAIVEFIQGMPVVRIFNQGNVLMNRFKSEACAYRDWNIKMITDTTGPSLIFILFLSLDIIIVLPVGFYLAHLGLLEPGVLIFFIIAIPLLTDAFYHSIYPYVEQRFSLEEGYRQITELMSLPDMVTSSPSQVPSRYDIEFTNVSFSYGEGPVLENVSFIIPEKTITALVGPSGAGKTTITSLISRFWDIQEGEIKVGGVNITHIPIETLLSSIAMVFQDVIIFNASVLDNIRIGNPQASDDELKQAAKAARCDSFIQTMPEGYDTVLGERGARLSEGQKQRLSIARAILKNAPILILDEATVYVDPNNEYEIQEALRCLITGKTVIVIAHRMSVIAQADQIIVLKNGRVEESGDHHTLIQKNGIYHSFWESQERARHWHV